MTTTTHASFVIEHRYGAAPQRVFAAWADPAAKRAWFAEGEGWDIRSFELDFREGGREASRFRVVGGANPFPPDTTFGNETVFNEITWDIHGSAPFSPIEAYRDLLGPMFDNAYASLLEDLTSRGMLDTTMVVAMGEFGRTPKINPAGGRDHWPQCWTVSMAGGGIKGGQVIGASDEIGAYPKDRPVPAAAVPSPPSVGVTSRNRASAGVSPAAAMPRLSRHSWYWRRTSALASPAWMASYSASAGMRRIAPARS